MNIDRVLGVASLLQLRKQKVLLFCFSSMDPLGRTTNAVTRTCSAWTSCDTCSTHAQMRTARTGCCCLLHPLRKNGQFCSWTRTRRGRTICSANLTVGKQEFELVALVEHASESTDARSGHYVTWVKEPRNWKKYDDLRSTSMDVLPETVHGGVVLAFYKKADECQQPVKNLEQPATASGRGRGAEDATSSPSKRTVRAPENAGRPKSPCREAGGRSRGRELLPEEHDGHMEFEEAVESLLAARDQAVEVLVRNSSRRCRCSRAKLRNRVGRCSVSVCVQACMSTRAKELSQQMRFNWPRLFGEQPFSRWLCSSRLGPAPADCRPCTISIHS